MHRFFVHPEWLQNKEQVFLTGPLAHQLSRVLRLRPGAHIIFLDDSGWAYEAEIDSLSPSLGKAHIVAATQPQTEPPIRLCLYQALLREQKFDWVLQKGTELGVTHFVPLVTERCVVSEANEAKFARWQRIITEAAEQSGRVRLPRILSPRSLKTCEQAPPDVLALIACLSEATIPLSQALRGIDVATLREIRLFIGPEGDFTPEEVAQARELGCVPISLGPRILRAETAGTVALAAILYALGDF